MKRFINIICATSVTRRKFRQYFRLTQIHTTIQLFFLNTNYDYTFIKKTTSTRDFAVSLKSAIFAA